MNVSMQIWFLSTCSSFRRGDTPADHMIRGTCHAEACEALDKANKDLPPNMKT